jgi:aminocarboxymuconate-semialdehyde decarboxylase
LLVIGVHDLVQVGDDRSGVARDRADRFIGFGTLPLQDIAAATSEVDYALDQLGLRGFEIASNINGVELDAAELFPVWERLADRGVPVLIHPHYVAGANRMGGYHLRNLIGNPTDTALAGARLAFGGVLDHFPGLTIVLSHGGSSLPGLIGRLEQGRSVRAEIATDGPFDAQLRKLYYDTIVFDHRPLRWLVETVGAERMVLGTDYPFDMGDEHPGDFIDLSPLGDTEKRTILGNGERLLNR